MSQRLRIFSALLAVLVLTVFCGCSKSNHDTIVPLGEENYVLPVDNIYPKMYRNQWPVLAPGYEGLYNGEFPPDINGEFLINGKMGGGNEMIHQYDEDVPYPYGSDPLILNKFIYIRIKDQKNGIAKLFMSMYNNPDGYKSEFMVDTAYVYGNGATNEFTLCFNVDEEPGNTGVKYFYGIVITGKIHYPDDNDSRDGIFDIKRWSVIKNRTEGSTMPAFYWLVGGQRLYYDVNSFAERVNYGWGFENE